MQMELAWEHSRNHNCHGQWELSQAFDKVFCRVDVFKSKRSCRCWASRSNFWWATSRIILWDVWTGCNCLDGVLCRAEEILLKVQRAFCFPSFELTKPRGANVWRWSWEKQSIATAIAEFSAASWSIDISRLGCFTCILVDDKDLKGSGWLSKTVMIWAKCLGAMYAKHLSFAIELWLTPTSSRSKPCEVANGRLKSSFKKPSSWTAGAHIALGLASSMCHAVLVQSPLRLREAVVQRWSNENEEHMQHYPFPSSLWSYLSRPIWTNPLRVRGEFLLLCARAFSYRFEV